MSHIGTIEAEASIASLIERAENGEEITIMRDGRAVARLIPAGTKEAPRDTTEALAAIADWLEESKSITTGGIGLREMIDEGRRY